MEKERIDLKILMNKLENIYLLEGTKLEEILDLTIDIIELQQKIINNLEK